VETFFAIRICKLLVGINQSTNSRCDKVFFAIKKLQGFVRCDHNPS
jgi:hypothetical protein